MYLLSNKIETKYKKKKKKWQLLYRFKIVFLWTEGQNNDLQNNLKFINKIYLLYINVILQQI